MLPIKLTIQGINSYQERQEIDFTPLLANKIFGIFGNTGSGKSTIPEAISFVLYDRMERMNKADSLNYNIMNLKSDKMLIEFEFESENSEKYKFQVEGKRNKKNFEDVTLKRAKYKWINNEWIPDENLNAEEIIGLNYDNFKRTIIIPQNRFMDFIQLGEKDRTTMMKELFGLEKYDLLGKVSELVSDNNINISRLHGQLENLKDITKEAIAEKENEISKTENNKKQLSGIIKKLETEFKLMDISRQLFEELSIKKTDFKKLNDSKEKINKLKEDLEKYNTCVLHFKNPLDRKAGLESQLAKLYDIREKLTSELEKASSAKEIIDTIFYESKMEFEKLDHYKEENNEIKKLIDIKEKDLQLPILEKEVENNKTSLDELLLNLKENENRINECRLSIAEKEKNLPDFRVLNEIQRWFDRYDHLKKTLDELRQNEISSDEKIKKTEDVKLNLLSSKELIKIKIDPNLDPNAIIGLLRSKTEEYEKGLQSIKKDKEDLMLKFKLKEFAHSLEEGSPCPVCGSLEHPQPIQIGNIEIMLKETEARIKNGETVIKNIGHITDKFRELSYEFSSENKIKGDISKSIAEKGKELQDHIETFNWKEYSYEDRKIIAEKINLSNTLNDEIKKIRSDIDSLEKTKKELENKKDRLNEEKNKLQNNFIVLKSEKENLIKKLQIIKHEDHNNKTIEELQEWNEKSALRIREIAEKHNKAREGHDKLKDTIIRLTAENGSNHKNIDQNETELNTISIQLKKELQLHGFDSLEQVLDILKLKLDTEKLRKEIEDYNMEYHSLDKRIKELEEQLKGKSFDKEKYENTKNNLESYSNEISEINKQIGALDNTIKEWKIKLDEKIKSTKKLDELELRKEDLKVMRSLFTASGFVKYVSMMKMQELVNYANSRFRKITRGRLSLDFKTNGSFTVIDHLNDGKKRNIKSLSGGQMFQASLSLALALAGVVQQQNKTKQNFFFLDEGFGTLDSQSLDLVFDAMSELRKENRSVGFISHVTELREGMSTYLETIYDENSGSRIIKSWERP